jgi:lipoyl(octanoyl) transferase
LVSVIWVCELGRVAYGEALALQERLREARLGQRIPDTLLLLEHDPPVYTRGRRSAPGELSMGEAWYAARGIEIIETRRGGKVTYHGLGQLVGYPIVKVEDVVAHVRRLEQALVRALAQVAVAARSRESEGPAYTGVWVQERKIASIGVHVSRGVAAHGFAINIEARALEPFGWIVACGLPDVRMTSVESERGDTDMTVGRFGELAAASLADLLGHEAVTVSPAELEAASLTGEATAVGNL